MSAIHDKRADLAAAIDEFRAAEAVYTAACTAREGASTALHTALRQTAGPDLSALIETRSQASLAASEALDALALANTATITRANIVVESAAGMSMRIAIDDLGATDPDVVAWRNRRNALIKDSTVPLVSVAG
jgi:hypothetical protein